MKKVTVYGGLRMAGLSEFELGEANKLGKFLGERKIEILTGACIGFPQFVGREAIKYGSKVVGYSPALNLDEHVNKYKFPTDGTTHLEFIKEDGANKAANFLQRSMDMNVFSDIVIAMGGSWGTYVELLFSFFGKKTIILIEGLGGAAEQFHRTFEFFDANDHNPDVHRGPTIIRCKDVDGAIAELKNLL